MNKLPNLIGVIHLSPLPGSPGAGKSTASVVLAKALALASAEAKMLAQNGFDGIILENFGDIPFYKTSVPPETIASLAIIAASIRAIAPKVKLGINVLRNDAKSALAIAAVTGADFIRVNVLSGVAATDQGMIEGEAAEILRERIRLNAEEILILADVHVKHAQTLSSSDIALAIEEISGRGGADAVIISGATTGRYPDEVKLLEAVHAAKKCGVPLYIGSGATIDSLHELAKHSVRVIVGSALRKNGKAGADLQLQKVREFSRAFAKAKQK
jgi:membrane complex biogenesis BtpA family protein